MLDPHTQSYGHLCSLASPIILASSGFFSISRRPSHLKGRETGLKGTVRSATHAEACQADADGGFVLLAPIRSDLVEQVEVGSGVLDNTHTHAHIHNYSLRNNRATQPFGEEG